MVTPAGHVSAWNPEDLKYKCCCSSYHVKECVAILGIFELITLVYWLASVLLMGVCGVSTMIVLCTGALVNFFTLVMLFCALKCEKPYLLLPHMILKCIFIVILICSYVVVCIFLGHSSPAYFLEIFVDSWADSIFHHSAFFMSISKAEKGVALCFCILLALCIHIWFLDVIALCYRYYTDKGHNQGCETQTPGNSKRKRSQRIVQTNYISVV